jgi:endonuclease/exonuclease/phosphatase family metal-dependent hydrolase
MKLGRLVAVASLSLALAAPAHAAIAQTSSSSAAARAFKFFTDNVGSGSECNYMNPSTGPNCLTVVDNQLASYAPDAISVDEVCQSDVNNFRSTHPGWTVVYQPDADHASNKCGYVAGSDPEVPQSHGNFVAAPGSVTALAPFRLDGIPTSSRTMYLDCLKTSSFTFCTVHLPTLDSDYPNVHLDELKEIAGQVESLKGDVIVAGDFNMQPDDPAFAQFSKFQETDPSDTPTTNPDPPKTTGVKDDYIWYHEPGNVKVASVSSHIVHQPHTQAPYYFDHNMLQGEVVW